jgi:predicted enzyme related to lactoylglutathione lyase
MKKNLKIKGSNVTIMVSSMAGAIKFYSGTLGLKLKSRESSHWAEVSAPGITIGLHPKMKNKKVKTGNNLSIGLQVKDFDEAVKALMENGIKTEVQKDSYVHLAYFTDPDKNSLYLFALKK